MIIDDLKKHIGFNNTASCRTCKFLETQPAHGHDDVKVCSWAGNLKFEIRLENRCDKYCKKK